MASRRVRGAKIPAFPVPEDFPQLLEIREGHLPPGPRHLNCPDQDSGLLASVAIYADNVAVHGSPMRAADRKTQRSRHGSASGYNSGAVRLTDYPQIRKKNGEGGLRGKPCEIPQVVACPVRGRAGEEIIPGSGRASPRWPASRWRDPHRGPTTTSSGSAERRRALRPPVPAGCDRP